MTRKIIIIIIMACLLLPVYFLLIGGFQNINGLFKMPPDLIPVNPTLKNYAKILDNLNVKWILNTCIVVLLTVVLSVFISTSAGYSLACFKIRWKKIIWLIILSGLMIPRITLYIPQYVILRKLGISGTLTGVILPLLFSPIGIYLSKVYFQTVPTSLIESARLDGANEFQILRHIIIPVSKPIITTLGLFAAMGSLGDYVWQMLVLQQTTNQTLLVGLMRLVSSFGNIVGMRENPIGQALAIGTLLLLPVIIIFLFASKYFTNVLSGMKE